MTPRSSANVEICFGPALISVKLYSVASERSVPLSLVHAKCGKKVEQLYSCTYCTGDEAIVPRPAIAKQYVLPDGKAAVLTVEELKTAASDRAGTIEIVECVPAGSVDPIYLGKAMFVGPQEGTVDGYAALVNALEETRTSAVGVLYSEAARDQLVLIERYRERGLLMRELFYANELRSLDKIELPVSAPAKLPGAAKQWTDTVGQFRKDAFDPSAYKDGYPDRLLHTAESKARAAKDPATASAPTSLVKEARKRVTRGELR